MHSYVLKQDSFSRLSNASKSLNALFVIGQFRELSPTALMRAKRNSVDFVRRNWMGIMDELPPRKGL